MDRIEKKMKYAKLSGALKVLIWTSELSQKQKTKKYTSVAKSLHLIQIINYPAVLFKTRFYWVA